MKKYTSHDVLTNIPCAADCGRMIKANVAMRKQNPHELLCFKCYKFTCTPIARTSREIRNSPHLRSMKRKHIPLRTVHA